MHLGPRFTNFLAERAAASILEHLRWKQGKVIFLSSGSEAVEFALNISQLATGRSKILGFSESYLSAYGIAGRLNAAPSFSTIGLSPCLHCRKPSCTDDCDELRKIDYRNVSAFILEPGCSGGRILFPPMKLVKHIKEKTRAAGGLIIVDEVTTGLGRTGRWFGFEDYQIKPDAVVLGKTLGNGYPVSAVALDGMLAKDIEKRNVNYIQSHQNDPLGCSIAYEVIKIIEEEDLIRRADEVGGYFLAEMKRIKDKSVSVIDVRGKGMMLGVEFSSGSEKSGNPAEKIYREMLKRKFIIGITPKSNILRFLPPLIMSKEHIDNMCSALGESLSKKEVK
jgi:acetylornithine aminotransferase